MKNYFCRFLLVILLSQSSYVCASQAVDIAQQSYSFAALSVPDLEASAHWYQKHFALTKGFSYVADDKSVQVLVLSRPGLTIELQQHAAAEPLQPASGQSFLRHGIFKFGVNVTDVKKTLATLEAEGVKVVVAPFEDQNGQFLSAIVSDNNGNLIQFFQATQARNAEHKQN